MRLFMEKLKESINDSSSSNNLFFSVLFIISLLTMLLTDYLGFSAQTITIFGILGIIFLCEIRILKGKIDPKGPKRGNSDSKIGDGLKEKLLDKPLLNLAASVIANRKKKIRKEQMVEPKLDIKRERPKIIQESVTKQGQKHR